MLLYVTYLTYLLIEIGDLRSRFYFSFILTVHLHNFPWLFCIFRTCQERDIPRYFEIHCLYCDNCSDHR